MPFDHNDHYHRLLLRHLPAHGRTALDVGCGTGRFARRLVARGYRVDALDRDPATLAAAEATGGGPRYRLADASRAELPPAHYDVISCLASLHHMPFTTLTRLRAALAPGGRLLVLGCYAGATAWDIAAIPANAGTRLAVYGVERARACPRPARGAGQGTGDDAARGADGGGTAPARQRGAPPPPLALPVDVRGAEVPRTSGELTCEFPKVRPWPHPHGDPSADPCARRSAPSTSGTAVTAGGPPTYGRCGPGPRPG
ncbi:class I SAM-dependent methyltransferase [Streptomyces sp. Q6]|uniref:Class I SAM-dependent methyltransferase n=1 Tax=Streptomyces citrinus TaxID=3118173 RepID=A0ACD5AC08_9ACTN